MVKSSNLGSMSSILTPLDILADDGLVLTTLRAYRTRSRRMWTLEVVCPMLQFAYILSGGPAARAIV